MIELWDYQDRAVTAATSAIQNGRHSLIVSPTGSGKTVMIGELVVRSLRLGAERIVVVSHRKEIIEQTVTTLMQMDMESTDIGVLRGGASYRLRAPVVVANISSLHRHKGAVGGADILVVDEAHHALAKTYASSIEFFRRAKHVGFTATPFRLDGKGLADFYNEMFVAATPSQLIRENKLAKPVVFRAPIELMPNLRDVRIASGDYVLRDLYERVNTAQLMGHIVENYQRHAMGKRAIAFGVSIEHARRISETFIRAGITSAHIHGGMRENERDQILRDFREGRIEVLSNCVLVSEGYDLPECEAIILARPTKSLTMYLQQVGRGMRYMPGKRTIVLDHARLMDQFGLPDADREFVLTNSLQPAEVINPVAVKDCPECGETIPNGAGECPSCGFIFETVVRSIPMELPLILQQYTGQEMHELEERIRGKYPDDWVNRILKIWSDHRAST